MHWPFRVTPESFLAIRRFSLSVGASTPVWTFETGSQLSGFIFRPEDRGSCHYNNEFPKEHWRSGQSPRSRLCLCRN